jgi:hypothetical protein
MGPEEREPPHGGGGDGGGGDRGDLHGLHDRESEPQAHLRTPGEKAGQH